jgi:hypothetical protein
MSVFVSNGHPAMLAEALAVHGCKDLADVQKGQRGRTLGRSALLLGKPAMRNCGHPADVPEPDVRKVGQQGRTVPKAYISRIRPLSDVAARSAMHRPRILLTADHLDQMMARDWILFPTDEA